LKQVTKRYRFLNKIVSERNLGLQLGPARQSHRNLTKLDRLGSISWAHARHDRGRTAHASQLRTGQASNTTAQPELKPSRADPTTPRQSKTPCSQIEISHPVPVPSPRQSNDPETEDDDDEEAMASALSSLRYGDSLLVVAISAATAVLCEAISWLLIYRTATYNSLRASIERHSRKLDAMKSGGASASSGALPAGSSRAKKMDRVETSLKDAARELSLAKLKSGAVVAAVLFVVFGLLNSLFEGRAVAKLPFAPVPLVQRMSHRGLPGNDPTDCSMVFLYFLCSMSIRTNLQKLLGFAPPRAAAAAGGGLFPMPDPKVN
jgi:calcium load-activated calcium channel